MMNKLKTIFSLTIAISILVVVLISTSISSNMNKRFIETESSRLLKTTANYVAKQLESELEKYEVQIQTIANQMSAHYSLDQADLSDRKLNLLDDFDSALQSLIENTPTTIATYTLINHRSYRKLNEDLPYPYQVVYTRRGNDVALLKSNLVTSGDLNTYEDYMNWYHNPFEFKKGTWSQIYYDNFLNETIITYSAPVTVNDEIIAIIGIDIKFNDFYKIVQDIKVYETGYAFLFDSDFNYLVHPIHTFDENLINIFDGQYAYMKPLFLSESTGIINYYYNDQDKILAFTHLENGWIVAVAPPLEEVNYFYNDFRRTQYIIVGVACLLAILLSWLIGSLISKPFHHVAIDINNLDVEDLKSVELNDKHFIYEVDIINKNFSEFTKRLSDAFNAISEQNKNLENQVELRTLDIQKNTEKLEQYILELENTQDLLLQAQKEKEINDLIKIIAHNINTPLGTAITTYSYLDNVLDKKNPKINTSLDIITDALQEMRRIINGLSILTTDYKQSNVTQIELETLIESRFNWLKLQYNNYEFTCKLSDTKTTIKGNKSLLMNLIDVLFTYVIHHHGSNVITYELNLNQVNDAIELNFLNDALSYNTVKQFYANKDTSHLDLSIFDLDLYLLHAIVEALGGKINVKNIDDKVKWVIELKET